MSAPRSAAVTGYVENRAERTLAGNAALHRRAFLSARLLQLLQVLQGLPDLPAILTRMRSTIDAWRLSDETAGFRCSLVNHALRQLRFGRLLSVGTRKQIQHSFGVVDPSAGLLFRVGHSRPFQQ